MKLLSPPYRLGAAALAVSLIATTSCNRKETVIEEGPPPLGAVVELLRHDDTGLSVAKEAALDRLGQGFDLAGIPLRVVEHWSSAEAVAETRDDNPKELHAVELAWNTGEPDASKKESEWIYQTAEDGPAGSLPGLDLHVRVLPPGALPVAPGTWERSPSEVVQFQHSGRYFSVPAPGGEAFPGWTVQGIRTFEHALLNEDGSVEESDDADFVNRAVEVTLASEDGTVERHLCFPDHPELTKGIHPALLPVARLAGDGASQSRLAARDPFRIPGLDNDRLLLCPDTDHPGQFIAYAWTREDDKVESRQIDSLPAEVTVGDATVRLRDHLTHARSVVKWRRADTSTESADSCPPEAPPETDATIAGNGGEPAETPPALVVSWVEDGGHQRAVLPLDHPTPVRIGGLFQTFRYRNAP